jgi:glycosyltransferase involved in cell wall biosynthesis
MHCPTLTELPPPPGGKTGWPWTEESRRVTGVPDGRDFPRISVITPSFNQGEFIEETIRSVLLQGYPDIEYLVLDGGSTDGSLDIIGKYSPWLSYWVSERDGGQSDGINRGLHRASGQFATWINSDDLLCKDALVDHALKVGFAPDTVYVGYCVYIDRDSRRLSSHRGRVFTFEDLVRIKDVWRGEPRGHIDQPAVLFPRALAVSVGGLDVANHSTMDYDLWGQFFLAGAKFQYTDIQFGMFREHAAQKTHDALRQTESLIKSAAKLVNAANLAQESKNELLLDLDVYLRRFKKSYWEGTGRLAKMGLPPVVVNPLRRMQTVLNAVCKAPKVF